MGSIPSIFKKGSLKIIEMKTLLIAALLGTSLLSAQANGSMLDSKLSATAAVAKTKADTNYEEELKQKVEVQLYNLEMLQSQFKTAQQTIRNAKGSHAEIDKDYEYFYGLLNNDTNNGKNSTESEKAIQRLKKEYARKHKNRAAAELKEQKALANNMHKELQEHTRQLKYLKAKCKKHLNEESTPSLQKLASKIDESQKMLLESNSKNEQAAIYYAGKLQEAKKFNL
jgi:paraquat-inducible protein B